MYFRLAYNVGHADLGYFRVQAKTKAAAKGIATRRGLIFLGTPMRITKAEFVKHAPRMA